LEQVTAAEVEARLLYDRAREANKSFVKDSRCDVDKLGNCTHVALNVEAVGECWAKYPVLPFALQFECVKGFFKTPHDSNSACDCDTAVDNTPVHAEEWTAEELEYQCSCKPAAGHKFAAAVAYPEVEDLANLLFKEAKACVHAHILWFRKNVEHMDVQRPIVSSALLRYWKLDSNDLLYRLRVALLHIDIEIMDTATAFTAYRSAFETVFLPKKPEKAGKA